MQTNLLALFAALPELAAMQGQGLSPTADQQAIDFKSIFLQLQQLGLAQAGAEPGLDALLPQLAEGSPQLDSTLFSTITPLILSNAATGTGLPLAGKELPTGGKPLPLLIPEQNLLMQAVSGAGEEQQPASQNAQAVLPPDQRAILSKLAQQAVSDAAVAEAEVEPEFALRALVNEPSVENGFRPVVISKELVPDQVVTDKNPREFLTKELLQPVQQTQHRPGFMADKPVVQGADAASLPAQHPSQLFQSVQVSTMADVAVNHTVPLTEARPQAVIDTGSAVVSQTYNSQPGNNEVRLSIDIQQKDYDFQLARSMVWLLDKGQQQARLTLNPPELGTVNVQLELQANSEVRLNLLTHSVVAKEALDAAMPRLRELMLEQGMNLVQAEVSQQQGRGLQQQASGQEFSQNDSSGHEDLGGETQGSASQGMPMRHMSSSAEHSYIDEFA